MFAIFSTWWKKWQMMNYRHFCTKWRNVRGFAPGGKSGKMMSYRICIKWQTWISFEKVVNMTPHKTSTFATFEKWKSYAFSMISTWWKSQTLLPVVCVEMMLTPEQFADVLCDDLELPPSSFAGPIAQSIRQQCDQFSTDMIPEDEEDRRVVIKVCREGHRFCEGLFYLPLSPLPPFLPPVLPPSFTPAQYPRG